MMKLQKWLAYFLVLFVLAGCGTGDEPNAGNSSTEGSETSAEVESPYAGETIEVLVPFKEGGGTDVWGRAITPYLQKYLGDDVTIQVINVPGASGTLGANEFAQAREPDGLSMLISSGSNVLPYLFGQDSVNYDFNKFYDVIGSPQGAVVYVSPDTGVTSVEELCAASDLVFGGISAIGTDIVALVAFEMLELDFTPILGYDGRGSARVAFEQSEINLDWQASSAYVKNVTPLIEEGSAVPLFSLGVLDVNGDVARDPQFAELPSFAEAYEMCKGAAPSGTEYDAYRGVLAAAFAAQKNMWVHGDAPPERIAALTQAAQQTIVDPEFQELMITLIGPNVISVGEDARSKFNAAAQLPDDAFDWLRTFLGENYDTDI